MSSFKLYSYFSLQLHMRRYKKVLKVNLLIRTWLFIIQIFYHTFPFFLIPLTLVWNLEVNFHSCTIRQFVIEVPAFFRISHTNYDIPSSYLILHVATSLYNFYMLISTSFLMSLLRRHPPIVLLWIQFLLGAFLVTLFLRVI